MRTLITVWTIAMLTVVVAGCSGLEPDPNLQAQRDIARYDAMTAQERAREMESRADLALVEGDVHIRKLQAETSARILEMHEMIEGDYARLIAQQNAFVDTVNNHQSALINQTHVIEQQYDMWSRIDHNSEAAAENSWFANVGVIALAVVILGLIGLVVVLFARVERRLTST